jgi:hypothetical protein
VLLGHGEVVDLGSWFGSTTAALAMGLDANPRRAAKRAKVHAFDRFTWEQWMDEYADAARFGPYSAGGSFRKEFEWVVANWRDRIIVHPGDLTQQEWRDGEIELLLIDAMKSWELTHHILTRFCRSLIPGQAHVIHQDFGHCYTPWIHLTSYRLRDYLVPVQDVVRSDTVVFRVTRSLDDAPAALELTRASFDEREVGQAFEHSLRITASEKHSGIQAARAMLLVYDGDTSAAAHLLHDLESRHRLSDHDASAVRSAIEQAERADSSSAPAG